MKLSMSSASDAARMIVTFAGELTIYTAAMVSGKMREWISCGNAIACDLSGIKTIDGSGFQVLLLMKRECIAHNISLEFLNAGKEVTSVFKSYGETID